MNKLEIFAIRDRQLDAFMQPFFAPTPGAAMRAFSDMINDRESEPAKHPEDYDIYHLGAFETQSGKLTSLDTPKLLSLGTNLKR